MTTEISGTVEDENGNLLSGATVYVVRESDNSVVGVTTTDSVGEYQITGLSDSETYHVGAQYDDGSTKYAGVSFPFVEPFTDTGPIDDFEDGDILEYNGDKNSFNTQTTVVYEGGTALEMGHDNGSFNEIISNSGLPRYPSAGSAFSFRIYMEPGTIGEMLFGVQDSDNHYRARISEDSGGIAFYKEEGGTLTSLDSSGATIPTEEWLEVVVDWGDDSAGEITTISLYDSAGNLITDVSKTDATFTSGGIGWRAAIVSFSGNSAYFDIAQITTVGGGVSSGIDDFEDGDLAEYNDASLGTIITSPTFNGTQYAVQLDADFTELFSTSGLNDYPGQGDKFYAWYQYPTDETGQWLFGVQDASNYYSALAYPRQSEMGLQKNDAGSFGNISERPSANLNSGQWYQLQLDWYTDGFIRYTIYDDAGNEVNQVTASDTTFTGGGIGWRGDTNAIFDESFINGNATITNNVTEVIDDFQDGDLVTKSDQWDGWNGDLGVTTVSGGTATILANNSNPEIYSDRINSEQVNAYSATVTPGQKSTNGGDSYAVIIRNSAGTNVAFIQFHHTDGLLVNGTSEGSWSENTQYTVEFTNLDYSANTFDWSVSGIASGSKSMANNVDSARRFRFLNDASSTGSDREFDVSYAEATIDSLHE